MPREYRGKYAGFTLRTIAELMGCHESTAMRYVHALVEDVGGLSRLDKDHIGDLTYRYRNWRVLLGIYKTATERLPKPDYSAVLGLRPYSDKASG